VAGALAKMVVWLREELLVLYQRYVAKSGHGEKTQTLFAITDGPLGCTAVDSEQFMPQGWFATRGIVGELGGL
jgi:hypothetical protein